MEGKMALRRWFAQKICFVSAEGAAVPSFASQWTLDALRSEAGSPSSSINS